MQKAVYHNNVGSDTETQACNCTD